MQLIIKKMWELLLPISMPWQVVIVLTLVLLLTPLLVLRCLPWISTQLLRAVLFAVKLFAYLLCFFEFQVTQVTRKSKRQPPIILYALSDTFASSVRFLQCLELGINRLSNKSFLVPWVLRPKIWYALPFVLIPLWFVRPHLSNSVFSKLIDDGVTWWCSLESWAMTGKWEPSHLTCRYPNLSPRWDTYLKSREYKLRGKIQEYTQKIEVQPNNPIAYYNRGKSYLSLEDMEAAFKDYTASIQADSTFAPGHAGRGDIYLFQGDISAAFKEYSNSVVANPEYAPGYVGRGKVYLAMDDNSSAFKEFSAAMNIDSEYAPSYIGRGDVYQRIGDKDAALQEYKKALQINSNYAFAYARIGNLYYRNFGNREAAINEYERALEIFVQNGQIDESQQISSILDELNRYIIYTVKRGDSLSKISRNHGVSIQVIVSANKETYPSLVSNQDKVEIGWRLKIPQ